MTDSVACANCGTLLGEDKNAAADKRIPCPKCGSKSRTFSVTLSSRLTATASVSAVIVASAASLILQTVVVPAENTDEGLLVEAVAIPWFDIIDLISQDPAQIHAIPARKWEEIIAGAYKQAGFDEVTLTPRSGDYGRDVIAVKKGLGTIRVIDQVKAYKPGHLVTANDVRALMGVLQGDGASKGFLTTTSDFAPRIKTDPLIAPFIPSRLELVDGAALKRRLEELLKTRR